LRVNGFEWDDGNRDKCQNMASRSRKSKTCLCAALVLRPIPNIPAEEERLIAVGKTTAGRSLFAAFTIRTKGGRILIRVVTARYMHEKEIAAYEKAAHEKEATSTEKR